ncbi:MAG: DUF4349 domain-containing protein [Chthonomonadetes bacterium]|nr:DUF4349 domain-containing protein [Chthonomonadetes bacterium]
MSRKVVGVVAAVLIVALLVWTWLPHVGYKPASSPQVPEYGGAPGAPSRSDPMTAKDTLTMIGAAGEGRESHITLASLTTGQPERYLIKTATVTLEVRETQKALQQLQAQIKENKGYIADLREWTDALGNQNATVIFRVPASRFEDVLNALKGLGKPMEVQVSSEDVTEEYVDIDARLRNLKRTEERLLGHLSRTGRLMDTLAVERELSRVRQEIEVLEGRLRFLKHRVAYCTITVTLRQSARTQPLVPPESFSTSEVASNAVRSLVAFAQGIWSVLIWLAVWAVVWLPLMAIGWFGYRRIRRV